MLKVKVDIKGFDKLMRDVPRATIRAAEKTLDKTVREIKDEVEAYLPRVFDRPVPYTMNSLKVTLTQRHNMQASVSFKSPERMHRHYLWAQVEGGGRKLKGFERALDNKYHMPGRGARLNQYGNISPGQIRQLLSVLGRAEISAGYSANITETSKRSNRKPRDYIRLARKHGKLQPGVYERYQTGPGFGAKTKKTLPSGEWQKGQTVGQFSSVIRARGLRAILIEVRAPEYRKRLPFYEIGREVYRQQFRPTFQAEFRAQMAKGRR